MLRSPVSSALFEIAIPTAQTDDLRSVALGRAEAWFEVSDIIDVWMPSISSIAASRRLDFKSRPGVLKKTSAWSSNPLMGSDLRRSQGAWNGAAPLHPGAAMFFTVAAVFIFFCGMVIPIFGIVYVLRQP
jgi:hypothetical protein